MYSWDTIKKGLNPETFEVGDLVMTHNPTEKNLKPEKFTNQWIGQYVFEKKEGLLYRLKDLKGTSLKGVCDPIKLKKVKIERTKTIASPSNTDNES